MPQTEQPNALIAYTAYGMFFIHDAAGRVWDGGTWRGFGMAERYQTYRDAFKARRAAIASFGKQGSPQTVEGAL